MIPFNGDHLWRSVPVGVVMLPYPDPWVDDGRTNGWRWHDGRRASGPPFVAPLPQYNDPLFFAELYVARHTYVYSPFSAPLGCGSWGPVARGRSWCDFLVCRRRRQLRDCGWWGSRLDSGSEGGGELETTHRLRVKVGGKPRGEPRGEDDLEPLSQFMTLTSSPAGRLVSGYGCSSSV